MINSCIDAYKWHTDKNPNTLTITNEDALLTITKDGIILNEKLKAQLSADEYAAEVFNCLEKLIKGAIC